MTIRWGLIGAGDIASKRVVSAIQGDVKSDLVAVCRRSEAQLAQFADKFSIPQRFVDSNKLIASTDIDAVYIATPVACHLPQTIAAAKAGKHVLVEKPMALDPVQCKQMVEACDQAGVQLAVAYYRRFYPVVARCHELITSGRLGKVLSIACVTGNPVQFPADDWRVMLDQGGGGPLMDIGSHRIDLFVQLFGDVDSVHGSFAESADYEAEQAAFVTMKFQCGVHGLLQCYFGTAQTPDRLEIIGTDGRITIEDLNQGDMHFFSSGESVYESHPPADNLHAPLIEDFTTALEDSQVPLVSGKVGKTTNDIIAMAYQNACHKTSH
ncbi:MAG: Gfo/Idh/MocA family protein [Rubripirellula sp.]